VRILSPWIAIFARPYRDSGHLSVDKDEEAGLRAFAVLVGCHAGTSYPERPVWVERDGVREDVVAVDAQWREVERLGFRVRLASGARLLLYYVPELDLWSAAPSTDTSDGRLISRRTPGTP
jgi:hypothetical protein